MLQYVHHVHYVVESRAAMVDYFERTFGLKPSELWEDNHHGKVAHFEIGQTQIQFAEPTDPASGVGKYLAQHGPGVFHVAWGVEDIRKVAQELAQNGAKMKKPNRKLEGEASEFIGPNSLGTLVCNIDTESTQGILFQLIGPA